MEISNNLTVGEVIQYFLGWVKTHRSKGTHGVYKHHLSRFLSFVGDGPASELKAYHLLTWDTRWHPIQAVQRCFSWAKRDAGIIDHDPFSAVKRPRLKGRRRTLTRGELLGLMRSSPTYFRAVLLTMRESIARPQEVRVLAWEMMRWAGDLSNLEPELTGGRAWIQLDEYKAKERRKDPDEPRIIPISPRLGRFLWRRVRSLRRLEGPILTNSRGVAWTGNGLRCAMARLRQRLALPLDSRGERVVLYTLRHTAATEACALGLRDRLLASVMGHSSTRTTARYQHLRPDHILAAMGELEERKRARRRGPSGDKAA